MLQAQGDGENSKPNNAAVTAAPGHKPQHNVIQTNRMLLPHVYPIGRGCQTPGVTLQAVPAAMSCMALLCDLRRTDTILLSQ